MTLVDCERISDTALRCMSPQLMVSTSSTCVATKDDVRDTVDPSTEIVKMVVKCHLSIVSKQVRDRK